MIIMNYDDDGDDSNYVSQYQTNILHAHTGCLGTTVLVRIYTCITGGLDGWRLMCIFVI